EVEHALTRLEPTELPRIGDACERLDRGVGDVRELGRVAEVFGPGAAGREDELALRLVRDGSVGLLDLALQQLDIDVDVDAHRTSAAWIAGIGSRPSHRLASFSS